MADVNLIATLIFFASALSCIVLANYLSYRILRQVNSELPESKRMDPFGFSLDKDPKIARVGRRLYRSVIAHVGFGFLFAMAIASALACAWELGFFRFFHAMR
jgi:hypothetical protein